MNVQQFEESLQKEFEERTKGKLFFVFAFSEADLERQLMEVGLNPKETVGLGGGGFCKKEDYGFIHTVAELLQLQRADYYRRNITESLMYQLWNYEVFYTGNYDEFLRETMMYSDKFIEKHKKEINKVIADYQKAMYEFEGC